MYAVIATGGKQYKVSEGDIVKVEKLSAAEGDKVKLDIIMIQNDEQITLGDALTNSVCEAEVLKQAKDKKIVIFKYKAKKNVRKRQGHRQPYTLIKITSIQA